MQTMYQVNYRIEKLTKSGKPSKKANRFISKHRRFDTMKEAKAFAKQHPDPLGWTKIEPIQIDNTLLADIFHL
jgi:hypothetical protein